MVGCCLGKVDVPAVPLRGFNITIQEVVRPAPSPAADPPPTPALSLHDWANSAMGLAGAHFVFPAELDVPLLREALAVTLAELPSFAARVKPGTQVGACARLHAQTPSVRLPTPR